MVRKLTAGDFDFIYKLYMHPVTNPWLLYEMMDKKMFEPIYGDLLDQEIIYIYSEGGTDRGMFKLVPLTHRSSHVVYLGGLAIDPSSAGQGYGFQMIREIIEYARERGFLRIELSAAVINQNAVRLYTKAGFEKEGILRNYTHQRTENRFLGEVLMSYIM